ncbi:unnamed protein product, partial [Bubo scandiacus]
MRARAAVPRAIGGARRPPPAPPPAPRMRRAPPGRVPGACVCVCHPRAARRPRQRCRRFGTGQLGAAGQAPPGAGRGSRGPGWSEEAAARRHFRVTGGRAGPAGGSRRAGPSARPQRRRRPRPRPRPGPVCGGAAPREAARPGGLQGGPGPGSRPGKRASERGPGAGRRVSPCACAAPGLHGAGSALRAAADSLGRVLVLGR